jgi:molybdenum cofactor cytidylyltransferase
MGRPKLLLPYGKGTVLGALTATLHAAGAAPIVVVAAAADTALRAWCAALGTGAAAAAGAAGGGGPHVLAAINAAPERGMLSSIVAGLAALGGGAAVSRLGSPLLVTPGDLPALRAATVVELLRRSAEAGAPLAVPAFGGRRGHPLLVAAEIAPEIEALDPERGLRHLLDLHPAGLLTVEVDDPGCVADLDTPEDYRRLARQ